MNAVYFINNNHAGLSHNFFFVFGRDFSLSDNIPGIAHFVPERHGIAGNKADDGFPVPQAFIVFSAEFFKCAAQLSD